MQVGCICRLAAIPPTPVVSLSRIWSTRRDLNPLREVLQTSASALRHLIHEARIPFSSRDSCMVPSQGLTLKLGMVVRSAVKQPQTINWRSAGESNSVTLSRSTVFKTVRHHCRLHSIKTTSTTHHRVVVEIHVGCMSRGTILYRWT